MLDQFRRLFRSSLARLRPVLYLARRAKVRLFVPDVHLVGRGHRLAGDVLFRATDGGSVSLGSGCEIARGVEFVALRGDIDVGAGTFIGPWSTLVARSGISIGIDCLIAERVSIRDQDHETRLPVDVPISKAGFRVAPIRIGNGVWIGAGAVIVKGVTIGDGAVVAANSVVNRNVDRHQIVGGVPARPIGSRS